MEYGWTDSDRSPAAHARVYRVPYPSAAAGNYVGLLPTRHWAFCHLWSVPLVVIEHARFTSRGSTRRARDQCLLPTPSLSTDAVRGYRRRKEEQVTCNCVGAVSPVRRRDGQIRRIRRSVCDV